MDALGVHYIEGGWPGANPKDTEFFRRFADGDEAPLQATLTAFGMTTVAGNAVEEDPLLAGSAGGAHRGGVPGRQVMGLPRRRGAGGPP